MLGTIAASIAGAATTAAMSDDGGGSSSGTPARAVDLTPDEFVSMRDHIAQNFQGLLESRGGPDFEGDLAAGMTGQEQQFLDLISQTGQPSQASESAQGLMNQTIQGDFLSPDSNPFLQQSIEAAQRPVIQQFEQEAMPRLRSEFTQAGQRIQPQGSSPFDRAAGIAQQGLTQELGDISSEMAAQNFQQERGRQQQAAQIAPQLDQAQLEQTIQSMEASALPRLIEQQGIDAGLEEFQRQESAFLTALQSAGQLAVPQTETLSGQPATQSSGEQFASALAEGLGSSIGRGGWSNSPN